MTVIGFAGSALLVTVGSTCPGSGFLQDLPLGIRASLKQTFDKCLAGTSRAALLRMRE